MNSRSHSVTNRSEIPTHIFHFTVETPATPTGGSKSHSHVHPLTSGRELLIISSPSPQSDEEESTSDEADNPSKPISVVELPLRTQQTTTHPCQTPQQISPIVQTSQQPSQIAQTPAGPRRLFGPARMTKLATFFDLSGELQTELYQNWRDRLPTRQYRLEKLKLVQQGKRMLGMPALLQTHPKVKNEIMAWFIEHPGTSFAVDIPLNALPKSNEVVVCLTAIAALHRRFIHMIHLHITHVQNATLHGLTSLAHLFASLQFFKREDRVESQRGDLLANQGNLANMPNFGLTVTVQSESDNNAEARFGEALVQLGEQLGREDASQLGEVCLRAYQWVVRLSAPQYASIKRAVQSQWQGTMEEMQSLTVQEAEVDAGRQTLSLCEETKI